MDNLTATTKTGARLAYVNTNGAADTIMITINGTSLGNIARGADQQAFANNVDSAIKAWPGGGLTFFRWLGSPRRLLVPTIRVRSALVDAGGEAAVVMPPWRLMDVAHWTLR